MAYQPSWVIECQSNAWRSQKVNVIVYLESNLVYNDSAVEHFNSHATNTSPDLFGLQDQLANQHNRFI